MKKILHLLIILLLTGTNLFAQTTLFSDDFESYTVGDKLAEAAAGSDWTTWSNAPGGSEDATISDAQASGGSNSAKIVTNNDLILNLGEKTTGRYQVKFRLYVESNKGAFFGFLQEFEGSSNYKFGLSAYFLLDTGQLSAGGNEFKFDFPFDTWMLINVIIDLDNDFATMYIDGNEIASWVWSLGTSGGNNLSKLYGIDFWGYSDENGCSNYLDDIEYNQLTAPEGAPTNLTSIVTDNTISLNWDAPVTGSPTEYAIIRNDSIIGRTTNTTYDVNNINLLYPGYYTYHVRANYGEQGYSAPTNEIIDTVGNPITRKLVVFEMATGTWCSNCPAAARGAHDLIENGHDVAIIKYHGGDDYEIADGRTRIDYYGVSGYPTSKVDGIHTQIGGSFSGNNYELYKPLYDQRMAVSSTHDITIDVQELSEDNYQATITVKEKDPYFTSDLVLITALTESHIEDSWQGLSEVNNACRAMYPDANGTVLDFSTDTMQTIIIDFTMDSSWDPENCELTAFVQHNTSKEIIQANKAELPYTHYVHATITPADGATDIVRDADITISFDMAVRLLDDNPVTDPASLITLKKDDQNGEDVSFTATINDDKNLITVDPDDVLDAEQTYFVSIGAVVENEYDVAIEETSSTFTTGTTTGIHENIICKDLNMYPNPVKDLLNIEFNLTESNSVKVKIYNETGRLMGIIDKAVLSSGNQTLELDLSKFNNGLYFINLEIGSESISKKIQILK